MNAQSVSGRGASDSGYNAVFEAEVSFSKPLSPSRFGISSGTGAAGGE
ncbi:hypothetical protein [Nocardia vaccinii]|nr:hypothetical protein [Nocardia vaccinii]